MARRPTASNTVLLVAAPVVWALHFLVVYGFTGVVCARPAIDPRVVPWGVLAAGIAAVALLAAIVLGVRRTAPEEGQGGFARQVGSGLAALAGLAIAWETLPVMLSVPCA